MATGEWTHIRVRQATKDWLVDEIRRVVAAQQLGHLADVGTPDSNNPHHLGVSMDDMIVLLLQGRQDHRQRRRKARQTARARRKANRPHCGSNIQEGGEA